MGKFTKENYFINKIAERMNKKWQLQYLKK